ncbi:D-2-hydroxyglutarate dehydrogenase, mitochondrial [Tanacetum coccineum]
MIWGGQLFLPVETLDLVEGKCLTQVLLNRKAMVFVSTLSFIMPLDLGAKGSCQIGGSVSTNAGGLRVVHYGSLHGTVLGLGAILANGDVIDMLGTLRKDNTGYDLKHLFIGGRKGWNRRSLGSPASRQCPKSITIIEIIQQNFMEKLEAFLLHAMETGLVSDGAIAQDSSHASSFWNIREGIPEALQKAGAVYKYDLSIPVEKIANVVGYGHLGDGNLHLNVSAPKYDDDILAKIEPFVYEWTSRHRGSISAEHGLGLMKAEKIYYSKSSETVQLMASIKRLLDPNGVLNPYKVIPPSLLS